MIKNLKFIHKILIAVCFIVASAFTSFAFYNDNLQRGAIYRDLNKNLHELGSITASNIANWLYGRVLLIESLSQVSAINSTTESAALLLKQQALSTSFLTVFIGDKEGKFSNFPDKKMPDDYDPRTRPWYKDAITSNSSTITEPYIDASSGNLVLTVVDAVRKNGQILAVAGGDLSLQSITDSINSLDFNGLGYAFLVSADGKILVHPNKSLVMKSISELYPKGTPGINSDISEVNSNGENWMVTFTPIKGIPSQNWYLGLSINKDKAFSQLNEFQISAIVATCVAVMTTIVLLSVLIRILMQPFRVMIRAMHDIAEGEGDLTKRLLIQSKDEFGTLGMAFNRFVDRIHGSLREVSSATELVNEVAKRVVTASSSSMRNSDEQFNRTNSVVAAINELRSATLEIARNASQASHEVSDAGGLAAGGQEVVFRTISAMKMLSEMLNSSSGNIETLNSKTVNIGQILDVISSISQQTNLLALNAAIEAARAGEAGRGFAVVADEVRNLAHRTQESAHQVKTMIEELQLGARDSVSTMNQSQRHSLESVEIANLAGERLNKVTLRIAEIDGMNQSVAAATEEQTAVVESINTDIGEINALNHEGVENLQLTLQACSELEQQTVRLKQLVGSFRI
ncbi:methyl-accepting chemotaxis protein [Pseudomonas sp. GM49]|uniref:methyl-accepting chemotaxis protein n=1 Tax=Pseudomonas sp. GM49 TaxID=1144331 RepID=UPI0002705970|nr:methyl-accepting chemotaxis protein [Pseudomonas sp. GM49]EJM67404.1 methyl-accepting chemotaxis protein [Pseudomonas sp. GM49]